MGSTPTAARPLLLTGDDRLLDDLLRLCAALGATPQVAGDAVAARRVWTAAAVVVVGADRAEEMASLAPPRRSGVVLVAAAPDDTSLWVRAVAVGAERVLVLPRQQEELLEALAAGIDGGGRAAWTVSIVGGRGGAGASTLAAALALTAADRGQRSLLVDADPLGGGIDMALGSESANGLRWPDLASAQGRLAPPSLRDALPSCRSLAVLSWDRGDSLTIPLESMRSVLSAAQRGSDVVVIDCPRRLDAAAEESLARSASTLLLVPAEVRAIAAATRVLAALRPLAPTIGLVVRGPGPSGLDASLVAESLDLPLVAQMRSERGVAESLDEGRGPVRHRRGPLASCCAHILDTHSTIGRSRT